MIPKHQTNTGRGRPRSKSKIIKLSKCWGIWNRFWSQYLILIQSRPCYHPLSVSSVSFVIVRPCGSMWSWSATHPELHLLARACAVNSASGQGRPGRQRPCRVLLGLGAWAMWGIAMAAIWSMKISSFTKTLASDHKRLDLGPMTCKERPAVAHTVYPNLVSTYYVCHCLQCTLDRSIQKQSGNQQETATKLNHLHACNHVPFLG